MKNRKINFLKFGIFLFGISLLLLSCEKNESIINEDQDNKFVVSSISYNQIEKNLFIKNTIDKINKPKIRARGLKQIFSINTKKIIKVINSKGVTTYSFYLNKKKDKSSSFENFIIKQNKDEYVFYLIQYYYDTTRQNFPYSLKRSKIDKNDIANLNIIKSYVNRTQTEVCGFVTETTLTPWCLECDVERFTEACTNSYADPEFYTTKAIYTVKYNEAGCGGDNQYVEEDVNHNTENNFPTASGEIDETIILGVNFSLEANELITALNLDITNQEEIDWINSPNNTREVADLFNFGKANNWSPETLRFVILAIDNFLSITDTNYPGVNEGLPYEWWKDDSIIENNSFFNQDPYDVWRKLTQKEKDIFKLYPSAAIILNTNKKIAEQQTINFYRKNGINDNSDAFRHAFFNALNSRDMGKWLAKKLSDAHESETPIIWSLEVKMDLFNNNIGHQAGHDFPNNNDTQMINLIKDKINNGVGKYLDPINYPDPNFWINSLTGGPGNHGISLSTILKPTN